MRAEYGQTGTPLTASPEAAVGSDSRATTSKGSGDGQQGDEAMGRGGEGARGSGSSGDRQESRQESKKASETMPQRHAKGCF